MPVHDWTHVDAGIFHDFHLDWIFTLKQTLNQEVLPDEFYALAEQVSAGLHPDVLTLGKRLPPAGQGANGGTASSTGGKGGVAVAACPPPVQFTARTDPERSAQKRSRITIRHVSGDHVVAIVEIVSPGNKASRYALRQFIDKALEFLDGGVHLLILDLFPPGPRDPHGIHGVIWSEIGNEEFEMPAEKPLTLVAYAAGVAVTAYVEPTSVGSALPNVPLFLDAETYVMVPLEGAYQAAFEAVPRRWRDVLTPESN